ncbi:MAG: hypothetical protein RDV41_00700 [Planctomycetota bacterium]|nr:hypothetical protein [Planctomycetota bacterium]
MAHDPIFDTDENKVLLAIATRKQISRIGYGGIGWGLINIAIGVVYLRLSTLNVGLIALGVLMFGAGVHALRVPTIGILFNEALVASALFFWNFTISVRNSTLGSGGDTFFYLVLPAIIATTLFRQYYVLRPVAPHVAAVERGLIKATEQMCAELWKKKLKKEPLVAVDTNGAFRTQLMPDRALVVQRYFTHLFIALKNDVRAATAEPGAKKLKMTFRHPLGALKLGFDKKNSEKIKVWFAAPDTEGTVPESPSPPADARKASF